MKSLISLHDPDAPGFCLFVHLPTLTAECVSALRPLSAVKHNVLVSVYIVYCALFIHVHFTALLFIVLIYLQILILTPAPLYAKLRPWLISYFNANILISE